MSKKNALRKAMIRLNGPTRDTFMTIDVDAAHGAEAWEIANLPIPNFIITNPQNGHAHLVYWHARPIRKETDGTKSHAELYRKAVWVALTRAMEGGDLGYTEGLTKNPFSARWRMSIGTTHKYTLAELAAHLDLSQTRMVDIREGYDALNEYDRPKAVNAGEKMHRRAGAKMHHGQMEKPAVVRGTWPGSVTLNSAFQFDR
jgi:hypothetical protein